METNSTVCQKYKFLAFTLILSPVLWDRVNKSMNRLLIEEINS